MRSEGVYKKRWYWAVVLAVLLAALPAYADDDSSPPQVDASTYNGPSYENPNGQGTIQFTDGYTGAVISKEQFIANQHQQQAAFMSGTNRILNEGRQYLSTASAGADQEITQNTINGIEQSQKDVASMHAQKIAQAESLKPKAQYEKPKVLVSK